MKKAFLKALTIIFVLVVLITMLGASSFFFNIKTLAFSPNSSNDELINLRAENLSLRQELYRADEPAGETMSLATVYAHYPFNDRASITISQTKDSQPGDILTIDHMLIGQITEIFSNYAKAKTVFDPDWEFPVYVGPAKARGLFTAGVDPKITLVSKKEKINPGDIIYTADPEVLPVNLVVGSVGQIISEEGSPFWSASVAIPYNSNEIRSVSIRSLK